MSKNKKKNIFKPEEKLYKAIQGLFILKARQIGMSNKDMREILGCSRADVDAIAKVVNKSLSKEEKYD